MSAPILATKLYIPPPQPGVVLRPRLIERLKEGLDRRLTLVCAPAGFGKTTLLSEWVAGCGREAAWLSLDEGDNDPVRFLAYLVAALQTIAEGIGEGVVDVVQSPQPPPTESVLTALLNEIIAIEDDFVLVLDDYHAVDAKLVDDALTFLLDHQPPRMHLAIATREDPHLPLPRLRVRSQISELRATDLRFTPDEAAKFLKGVTDLDLSEEDIAAPRNPYRRLDRGTSAGGALDAGTRGRARVHQGFRWRQPVHRGLSGRRGPRSSQPERIRSFLLKTSILDRLSGPLCDAVTDQNRRQRAVGVAGARQLTLSFRWMTNASGIAIITSLQTFSPRI